MHTSYTIKYIPPQQQETRSWQHIQVFQQTFFSAQGPETKKIHRNVFDFTSANSWAKGHQRLNYIWLFTCSVFWDTACTKSLTFWCPSITTLPTWHYLSYNQIFHLENLVKNRWTINQIHPFIRTHLIWPLLFSVTDFWSQNLNSHTCFQLA